MDVPAYPKKELENRDVVARAMFWQKEVRLDLSGCDMDYLRRECPNIAAMWEKDPSRPLLLRPVAHFFMGGVPLRRDTSTDVKGLYVCGEVTGGLHGANRLAGSALTETALFGGIAGRMAAAGEKSPDGVPRDALSAVLASYPEAGEDRLRDLKDRLRRTMWENVSVVRTGAGMEAARDELAAIGRELARRRPADGREWAEMRNLLFTAEQVTAAALARGESLGAHYRTD